MIPGASIGDDIVVNQHWALAKLDEDAVPVVSNENVASDAGITIDVVDPDAMSIIVANQIAFQTPTNEVVEFDTPDLRRGMSEVVVSLDDIIRDT